MEPSDITPKSKLYVVVRADLSPGAMAAQACHGVLAYATQHPVPWKTWMAVSNTLVLLTVPDEGALRDLMEVAHRMSLGWVAFYDEDVDPDLTCLVFDPVQTAAKLCRALPLLLREPVPQLAEEKILNFPVAGSSPAGLASKT